MDWTGDGERILVSGRDRSRLEAVDIITGDRREVLPGRRYTLAEARLSPDGRWIAVRADALEAGCPSVFLARFAPGKTTRCADLIPLAEPDAFGFGWSPDGGLLYFFSSRDGFRCIWAQRLHPTTKPPLEDPIAVRHFHRYQQRPHSEGGIAVVAGGLAIWLMESSSSVWMAEMGPSSR